MGKCLRGAGIVDYSWACVKIQVCAMSATLRQERQIVSTEAGGVFPLVTILVEPGEGDVVPGAVLGVVLPDGGLDAAQTHFMDGLLLGHGRVPFRKQRRIETVGKR